MNEVKKKCFAQCPVPCSVEVEGARRLALESMDDDDDDDGEQFAMPCWLGQHVVAALFAMLFGFVGSLVFGSVGRAVGGTVGASLAITALTESGLERAPCNGRVKLIAATVGGAVLGAAASLALPRGWGVGELVGGLMTGGGATAGFNALLLLDPEVTMPPGRCELGKYADGLQLA